MALMMSEGVCVCVFEKKRHRETETDYKNLRGQWRQGKDEVSDIMWSLGGVTNKSNC